MISAGGSLLSMGRVLAVYALIGLWGTKDHHPLPPPQMKSAWGRAAYIQTTQRIRLSSYDLAVAVVFLLGGLGLLIAGL